MYNCVNKEKENDNENKNNMTKITTNILVCIIYDFKKH